jgi:hypothetical protein
MMVRAAPGAPCLVGPSMWCAVCCVASSSWVVAFAKYARGGQLFGTIL